MNNKDGQEQFTNQEERQIAISVLESEIQRLMDDIDKAYGHLGRSLCALTEQETSSINELTDRVVVLKQKLRKLKEIDAAMPS